MAIIIPTNGRAAQSKGSIFFFLTEPRTVYQTQRPAGFYGQVISPFTLLFMVLMADCCQLSWLQWAILTQRQSAADPKVKHLYSRNDTLA